MTYNLETSDSVIDFIKTAAGMKSYHKDEHPDPQLLIALALVAIAEELREMK